MSRKSSSTSFTSLSSTDDPLMRDCHELRQRLWQTEQSIQNLSPPIKCKRFVNLYLFLPIDKKYCRTKIKFIILHLWKLKVE